MFSSDLLSLSCLQISSHSLSALGKMAQHCVRICVWGGMGGVKAAHLPPVRKVLLLGSSFWQRNTFACEPCSCDGKLSPRKDAQSYPLVKVGLPYSGVVKSGYSHMPNVFISSDLAVFSSQEGWMTGGTSGGLYLKLMLTSSLVWGHGVCWVFLVVCEEASNLTISARIWGYGVFSEMSSSWPVFPVLLNFGTLIYPLMRSYTNTQSDWYRRGTYRAS